jgi:hypothetical protein
MYLAKPALSPTNRQNTRSEKIADIQNIHNIAQGLYILNKSQVDASMGYWQDMSGFEKPQISAHRAHVCNFPKFYISSGYPNLLTLFVLSNKYQLT